MLKGIIMSYKSRIFFGNILASFKLTKTQRRRVRDKILFKDFIKTTNNDLLIKPSVTSSSETINVAFCFDKRGANLAAVAITSLLSVSQNKCHYDIYCVIPEGLDDKTKKTISATTNGTTSNIIFLTANHDFDKSYLEGWPISIYYRTMLPKLLPNIDKIIYADIDVIFCNNLIEANNIEIGDNYIAGVKAHNDTYVNSGFLIMNLKQIRKDKMYMKWIHESQINTYPNPDQDLLNYTCAGHILYLPLKYNFQPMDGTHIFKNHTAVEISDIQHHLVVLHFSNWMKPWHKEANRPVFSELWWKFANETSLFK